MKSFPINIVSECSEVVLNSHYIVLHFTFPSKNELENVSGRDSFEFENSLKEGGYQIPCSTNALLSDTCLHQFLNV